MATLHPETLTEEVGFPEGLRWHSRVLWFSDFYRRWVCSVTSAGVVSRHVYVAGQPSGLGWLADGSLLVASMHDRRILRAVEGTLELHADLSSTLRGPTNDMLTGPTGHAYVGSFGYELHEGLSTPRTTALALIDPDGRVTTAAEDLLTPNGMAMTRQDRTLVVAETLRHRLTAFAVASDGTLADRYEFADLDGRGPDGICTDAAGAVWAACNFPGEGCVRVSEGGSILDVVATPGRWAIDCALGGFDGRTLFIGTC